MNLIPHFGAKKDLQYFLENLGLLVGAGMSITQAITSIREDVQTIYVKKILQNIEDDVNAGSPFWQALANTKVFPLYAVSLIRIGEETGNFGNNLRIVADQETKNHLFREKIASAVAYPGFVLGVTLIVGIGISWFILPRLSVVFRQMHVKLPLLTRLLIGFGAFVQHYGIVFFPSLLILLALISYILFVHSKTKFIGQTILFHVPGVKTLIQQVELARMGYLFGTLLQAGVPITLALESLENVTLFPGYKALYKHIRINVESGESIRKSFVSFKHINRYVPSSVQQLLYAGELSGNFSATLIKVGGLFNDKTETTTKNLATIIEPILLVIVALGVALVAVAVILPIYSLVGNF